MSVDRNVTLIYYSTYIYTCPLIVMLLLYTILYIFIRVRRTLSVDRNVTLIYYSTYIYTCPLIVMLLLYTILRIFIRVR